MKRRLWLLLLLFLMILVLLPGCEMVDSQMLQQLQQYFPAAEIVHPQADKLMIVTHVSNVTERFVAQTVATLLREHCCHGGFELQDLNIILPAAGYSALWIDFESARCGWAAANLETFGCFSKDTRVVHTYAIQDQTSVIPQIFLRPAAPVRPVWPRR